MLREMPGGATVNDYAPEWWPDGSKLLFTSNRDAAAGAQLFTVPAAGGPVARFSTGPGSWSFGRWSPDGEKLAAVGDTDGVRSIYLLDTDGAPIKRLTRGGEGGFDRLAWSPDSSKIAFPWDRDGASDIWYVDIETGALRRVTRDREGQGAADWSPDGEWIAFMARYESAPGVFRVRPDGTGLQPLVTTGMVEWWPSYSPDGERIAFWAGSGPDYNVFLMDADGANRRAITDRWDYNWCPSWSPDGSRIAFDSRHSGRRGVHVMRANGADAVALTNEEPVAFERSVLEQGVTEALGRLAFSRRAAPDRVYTDHHINRALVRRLIEAERADEAVRLAQWSLLENPADSADADAMLLALRASGVEAPPLSVEIVALFRSGDMDRALAMYESARARFPDWPTLTEGWFAVPMRELWGRADHASAIRLGEVAVRDLPASARLHALLARALHAAGRRDRAAKIAARALELDPTNNLAQLILDELRDEPGR